jgi:dephospho-CoA kinase
MKPRIIGIVGPIRSGKTTASTHLRDQHEYVVASNSEILKRICGGLILPASRQNLKRVGDAIFEVLGNETLARFRVANLGESNIVVDGIRYFEEVDFYRKNASFKLISLQASEDVRFERAMALIQQGKDYAMARDEFASLGAARSEAQVPMITQLADCILENNGTMAEFAAKLDDLLDGWTSGRSV